MMGLTQVKGNTWVVEAMGLIPFYKLDERHVILLDTGLQETIYLVVDSIHRMGFDRGTSGRS